MRGKPVCINEAKNRPLISAVLMKREDGRREKNDVIRKQREISCNQNGMGNDLTWRCQGDGT